MRINKPCVCFEDLHMQYLQARNMAAEDLAIFISYAGEIQRLKEALPMDSRVNVIGTIGEAYMELVDFVPNGYKICFVKNK